jgi:hypothetical protein
MKGIKKILIGLLFLMIAVQFYRPMQNRHPSAMPDHISKLVAVPDSVETILHKACYDCHSNNTMYPWYAHLQPINWLMNRHINNGKAELNFDNFKAYTPRRRINKLRSIENSVEDGTMPLASYTLIHKNAVLNQNEKQKIIAWTKVAKAYLEEQAALQN